MTGYVHGYSEREAERLHDQAATVRDLLHHDTSYPPGSRVLEPGCGVGAQTVTLAANSPEARFVSFDLSEDSLAQARRLVGKRRLSNVQFLQADIYEPPFDDESFDHVFVCYVLEHLSDPLEALAALRRVLKPRGSITVIEGDHGSCHFHPDSEDARKAWQCLIDGQAALGGDSLIGRRLYPLLRRAGFTEVRISPRIVYCDHSKPSLVEGFVRKTIIAMVEGVRERAGEMGLIDAATWERGMADLNRVASCANGTFCYTFFKGLAVK